VSRRIAADQIGEECVYICMSGVFVAQDSRLSRASTAVWEGRTHSALGLKSRGGTLECAIQS
jgi:hypothetical protein